MSEIEKNKESKSVSKQLQDKADRIMKELKEALTPIKEELQVLKKNSDGNK